MAKINKHEIDRIKTDISDIANTSNEMIDDLYSEIINGGIRRC